MIRIRLLLSISVVLIDILHQKKPFQTIKFMTHNQRVWGSSPCGPTTTKADHSDDRL